MLKGSSATKWARELERIKAAASASVQAARPEADEAPESSEPREARGRGQVRFDEDPEVVPLQPLEEEGGEDAEDNEDVEAQERLRVAKQRRWNAWYDADAMWKDAAEWARRAENKGSGAAEGDSLTAPRARSNRHLPMLQTLQRALRGVKSEAHLASGEDGETVQQLKDALREVVKDTKAVNEELEKIKGENDDPRVRYRLAVTAMMRPRMEQELAAGMSYKKALTRMQSRVRTVEYLAELSGALKWRDRQPPPDPNRVKKRNASGTKRTALMNPTQKATHNNKRKQGRDQQEIAFRILSGLEAPSDAARLSQPASARRSASSGR